MWKKLEHQFCLIREAVSLGSRLRDHGSQR
jgi:hypothetical protein